MENQEVKKTELDEIKKKNLKKKSSIGCLIFISVIIFIIIIANIGSSEDEENTNTTQPKTESNLELNDSVKKEIIEMYNGELETISKSITSKYDDFEGITWYSHKNQPKYSNTNACYLYAGSKNKQYWGRLVVRFSGEDWIFVKRIIVKCDEIKLNLNTTDVKRDNSSGDVWEWIDISYDRNEQDIVLCIINSKEIKIRFEGDQYSKDYTLTSKEKNALIDMYKFIKYNNEIASLDSK